MYKNIFVVIAFYMGALSHTQQYVLRVHSSYGKQQPHLQAYYKGHQLNLADPSFCPLPERTKKAMFSIIICNDIAFEPTPQSKNGISGLRRPEGSTARWITTLYDTDTGMWSVQQDTMNPQDMPHVIPEDAIYIMADPYSVDLSHITQVKHTTYISIQQQDTPAYRHAAQSAIWATLASLDARAYHAPVHIHQLHAPNATISMLYQTP